VKDGKYILNDKGEPVACPDLMQWAMWFEKKADPRRVGQDENEEFRVSTVFLGLDHNFDDEGPPIFWETMVFRHGAPGEMCRCAGAREQAEAMHVAMCDKYSVPVTSLTAANRGAS
jgi:hypothetical protein